eukprot:3535664-Prorocentrum_lima.AAC.1
MQEGAALVEEATMHSREPDSREYPVENVTKQVVVETCLARSFIVMGQKEFEKEFGRIRILP